MTHDERYELGLRKWIEITEGEVYVDFNKVYTSNVQDVLLGTQETSGGNVSLQYMTADEAEMLGMRLIMAAREYRKQATL